MRPKTLSTRPRIFTLVAMIAFTAPALAQQPFVYPSKGQSQEKMATDKAECQSWATQQTGFDPMKEATAQPAPSQQSQRGGVLRGGARGAAAGAAIGAIAGNAGEGAAIGAASGGLLSGAKRRQQQKAEQQTQTQQAQAHSQQVSNFQRAYGACLKGRGYSVE
jgi:Glycine zipper